MPSSPTHTHSHTHTSDSEFLIIYLYTSRQYPTGSWVSVVRISRDVSFLSWTVIIWPEGYLSWSCSLQIAHKHDWKTRHATRMRVLRPNRHRVTLFHCMNSDLKQTLKGEEPQMSTAKQKWSWLFNPYHEISTSICKNRHYEDMEMLV